VDALVTAYNDAMNIFDELTNPKSTLATYGGTMVGNSTINSLRTQLRTLVTQDSSTKSSSGTLTAFRDIGIEIDSHGLLKSNSVKLDLALNTDFANTVTLLSGNQENQSAYDSAKSGLAGDASKTITTMLSSTNTIAKETANANTRISKDQDELSALNDRMANLLTRYTKQFAAMDSIVGHVHQKLNPSVAAWQTICQGRRPRFQVFLTKHSSFICWCRFFRHCNFASGSTPCGVRSNQRIALLKGR
jgi:flagellar hook-associated protein 2